MRLIPLLFVSVALVLAGCSKEDDTPPDDQTTTTTTPTGGATTTTTTTPTGSTTNPTGGGNGTTPAAPTPMELCAKTKDFTPGPTQAPTPPDPVAKTSEACGTPGAGYTKISLNVTWAAATAVPATPPNPVANPTVKLVDSTGAAVGSCGGPSGQDPAGTCLIEGAVVAGEYTLAYEGNGNLRATIQVMVS